MNRILGIDHSRIVDLLQVFEISCTKLYDRRVGDREKAVKGFPCRQVGIPTQGGGAISTFNMVSMRCGLPKHLMEIESKHSYF